MAENKATRNIDILLNGDGKYENKLNGRTFGSYRGFETDIKKNYNMTSTAYLIRFGYVNKEDYPKCEICGEYASYLRKHITDYHKDYTKESYIKQFGEPEKWVADTLLNTIKTNSTNNNGNSKSNTTEQQRKERSPMAIEFYQKKYPDLSPTEHLQMLNEAKNHISGSIKNHTTRLEYWIEKTGGDIEEAKELLKKRQTTFSLDICVSKLGYDAGIIRHTNRQIQWNGSIKSNLKCGYSKVSNKFFDDILSHYKEEDKQYVYFNGHNGEYTVKDASTGKTYRLDFYDSKNNFIIEFQGDIYHGNPAIFTPDSYPHPFHKNQAGWTAADIWKKDAIKKDISKNALPGVKYLQLWESKYREDSTFCLEKVVKLIC